MFSKFARCDSCSLMPHLLMMLMLAILLFSSVSTTPRDKLCIRGLGIEVLC